mmetsp:Transcript_99104/g.277571  ORF Transcript_99104/g.277571 Transcript_99104/m.277571 type:complete len:211 (+) Transcript_99104:497-1129(+)
MEQEREGSILKRLPGALRLQEGLRHHVGFRGLAEVDGRGDNGHSTGDLRCCRPAGGRPAGGRPPGGACGAGDRRRGPGRRGNRGKLVRCDAAARRQRCRHPRCRQCGRGRVGAVEHEGAQGVDELLQSRERALGGRGRMLRRRRRWSESPAARGATHGRGAGRPQHGRLRHRRHRIIRPVASPAPEVPAKNDHRRQHHHRGDSPQHRTPD